MFRLSKALGYQHVADFLTDPQAEIEFSAWVEYERIEEERQTNRLIAAIRLAFAGGGKQQSGKHQAVPDDDNDEVIDTTNPEFVKSFKGFVNKQAPAQQQRPAQRQQLQNTQIIMG